MSTPHDPTPTGDPVLEIDELTVGFGDRTVVDRVSLLVRRGEVVALVGESGSGKSLTARSVLGLLPATAHATGSIRLGGTEVIGATEAALRTLRGTEAAMVFQEPQTALNPVQKIGTQLVQALRAHGTTDKAAARARAIELLAAVDLPEPEQRLDWYPHQLSGGQKQRVVIALALSGDPALLIADEPTTALDVTVQAEILDLLRTLQRERGTAILFITHNLGVVAEIADRVVVMRSGQVVEEQTVFGLFAEPGEDYTRTLLAAVPRLPEVSDRGAAVRAAGAKESVTAGLGASEDAGAEADSPGVDAEAVGESGVAVEKEASAESDEGPVENSTTAVGTLGDGVADSGAILPAVSGKPEDAGADADSRQVDGEAVVESGAAVEKGLSAESDESRDKNSAATSDGAVADGDAVGATADATAEAAGAGVAGGEAAVAVVGTAEAGDGVAATAGAIEAPAADAAVGGVGADIVAAGAGSAGAVDAATDGSSSGAGTGTSAAGLSAGETGDGAGGGSEAGESSDDVADGVDSAEAPGESEGAARRILRRVVLRGPAVVAEKGGGTGEPEYGDVLRIDDLSVVYPGQHGGEDFAALRDISLTLGPREVLGLVGESGSGKSTLGRTALGLVPATSGIVTLQGVSLAGLSRRELRGLRKNVALVHQDVSASLDPRRSVADAIGEPLQVHRVASGALLRSKVGDLLESVRLPRDYAQRRPGELSGGQRQRVALARALALAPRLLVADEPTSALDVSVQAQVLDLFADLRAEYGFASLFISHDLAVVHQVADRVVVLRQGRIVETGEVRAVFAAPAQEYTRRLLDAVPVPDPARARRGAAGSGANELLRVGA